MPTAIAIKSDITCSITAIDARIAWSNSRKEQDTDADVAAWALLDLSTSWEPVNGLECDKLSPTRRAFTNNHGMLHQDGRQLCWLMGIREGYENGDMK